MQTFLFPSTRDTKTHLRRLQHRRRELLHRLHRHHNRRLPRSRHVSQPFPTSPQTYLILSSHSGEIVKAGIDASVTIGTSNTSSITTAVNCPDNCDCGLQAVAHMYQITGIHNVVSINPPLGVVRGSTCNFEQNVAYPYSVTVPQTIPGGTPNADAIVDYAACRQPNTMCGSWDAPLLPLCPAT